jgi:NAD(P)-dependent dehydrogenase (short-subunit alcohol dehydrogenase family)
MSGQRKTAIVTGASQGIGAGIVKAFVERGFNVVANSRDIKDVRNEWHLLNPTPLLGRLWIDYKGS